MMEISYMVFHPQMPYGWGEEEEPELAKKLTIDLMADLLPVCEKYGVTICLENMPFRKTVFLRWIGLSKYWISFIIRWQESALIPVTV